MHIAQFSDFFNASARILIRWILLSVAFSAAVTLSDLRGEVWVIPPLQDEAGEMFLWEQWTPAVEDEQPEVGEAGISCRIRLIMDDSWSLLLGDLDDDDILKGLLDTPCGSWPTEDGDLMEVLASIDASLDRSVIPGCPPLTSCLFLCCWLISWVFAGVAGTLTDLWFWCEIGDSNLDGKLMLRFLSLSSDVSGSLALDEIWPRYRQRFCCRWPLLTESCCDTVVLPWVNVSDPQALWSSSLSGRSVRPR